MSYRHNGIISKMAVEEIKDFSDEELNRVFAGSVMPNTCVLVARKMIAEGLTIEDVYERDCYISEKYKEE